LNYKIIALSVWTVLLVLLLGWSLYEDQQTALESARIEARALWEKDIIYRTWNARHGGVYVPITETTQPNPYLDVPERDIETPLGKQLTLINPAYMTRQIYEIAKDEYGIEDHITSLNPIRPQNKADDWEAEALSAFEAGQEEYSAVVAEKGKQYLRLMKPLITEQACLQCHEAQGYKIGDVRGGISVKMSMEDYLALSRKNALTHILTYLMIWGIGGVAIFWMANTAEQHLQKIQDHQKQLENTIAERKQAEEALRESEEHYRTLFEHLPIPVFTKNREGEYTSCNAENHRYWAVSPIGRTDAELLDHETAAALREVDLRVMETGDTLTLEEHLVNTPSGERQLLARKVPLRDGSGNIVGILGASIDITERKRAAETMRLLESGIQNATDSIVITTTAKMEAPEIIYVNPAFAKMTGYSAEEIIGKTPQILQGPKTDRSVFMKMIPAILRGETFYGELISYRKDGTEFYMDMHIASIPNEAGEITHYVSILRDITERKQAEEMLHSSEERFSKAFHASPNIMAISTLKDGRYLDVNKSFCHITGYSREEVIGRTSTEVSIFVNAEDRGRLAQKLKEQGWLRNEEADIQVVSGAVRIGLFSAELIEIAGEQCLLSVMDDITERKQAEEERLKLKKLESVGVLAGGIAHDFNNLLTGVFGNIEMAKMFLSADHKSYKFLESAGRSMDSATNLTKQLLTFAKGGDPIKETLSIGEVITEMAQFSMRGSNVKLQSNIAPDLWPVEADKGQLSQVISNLVINAQQAMPAGGAITIAAENVETSAGRYVQITVQDEGVGIAPQYLDKIFDPYFSTKQKGSGLGLASTHSIISKHNGRITVDSQLDQGTIFTIHLPAAEETEETIVGTPLDKTGTTSVASVHILVLDDEEMIRKVTGAMLEEMGYKVSFAVDGQEAIAKYRASCEKDAAYDIVITDLTIPGGMGGQEAAQEILSINPAAKIIVSSGYATDPVMANYKAYGFQGIAVKPYHFAELQKVIQQVLKT